MNRVSLGAPGRRTEIRRLVRESRIRSQDELLALLRRRGFRVTQPTLSRDLREMEIVKTPGGYVCPEDFQDAPVPAAVAASPETREERLAQAMREAAISVEAAGTLVVLRTPPAAANALARVIDQADLSDAAGTVAGDDTVFVAARGEAAARRLAGLLLARTAPARQARRRRA